MRLLVEKVTMHMDVHTFEHLKNWVDAQSQSAGEFDILVGEVESVMFDTDTMEEVSE
jgi:hypothetical protein